MPVPCPENICIQALPPDHLESIVHRYRYAWAREHAFGFTADLGCGYGYGSEMLRQSPTVSHVRGFDVDAAAIWHAQRCFPACEFWHGDLHERYPEREKEGHGPNLAVFDTVVAIECLEHLAKPADVLRRFIGSTCGRVVVSFPIVPTVGKNPHHEHDLAPGMVAEWLPDFTLRREETLRGAYWLGCFHYSGG